MGLLSKSVLPTAEQALEGREESMAVPDQHYVNHQPLRSPFPARLSMIYLGLGCFWGAERLFWQQQGVYTTAVGYAGGFTANPTYEEVCSGGTGHAEVVLVVYDEQVISTGELLKLFWESHDPTQGVQQGNDRGTQYRSAIYTTTDDQLVKAEESKKNYGKALNDGDYGSITTEIRSASEFYYAESYHQQYLAKNPEGYCGLGGTGICMPPSLNK